MVWLVLASISQQCGSVECPEGRCGYKLTNALLLVGGQLIEVLAELLLRDLVLQGRPAARTSTFR